MTDNERKESISALRQLLAMCDFVDQYGDSIDADPYFDAIEIAIESLNETGWIPVSERLPEKDGSYLVCMNWDYRNMDVLMWADGWNCIRLINGKVNRKSEIDGEKITAWMPLPEPYKGGDDE
jgi:hypothetical protein